MSKLDHGKLGPDSPGAREAADGSHVRVFVVGAIVIVVVIAALLTVIRVFLFPVWEANSDGARQVATAQVQLAAAMTQEAVRPAATSTVLTAAAPTRTSASTATVDLPQLAATLPPTVSAASTVAPTSFPTPTPDQTAEIALAYRNYFDVTGQALLNLDPTPLDQVAAGQSLAGLQQTIEQDRAQGRALDTNVQHEQVYVVDVHDDQADVADRYRDSSIYVDPVTHEALPGEVAPASPDLAPTVSVIYHLQRIDGTWKVVSGERFAPQGGQ
jgi:hypothetical protein